jgi:hypothetical protein
LFIGVYETSRKEQSLHGRLFWGKCQQNWTYYRTENAILRGDIVILNKQ